ncbi:MAG: DUF6265 family protein [Pseudomonadota bacterium]
MLRFIASALFTCLFTAPALAQDLSWRDVTPKLQGCWDGTGMGGSVSECWLVAEDGRADGLFLMRQDGAPTFSEILTIDDFGEGVEMRLKHVNPDMTGWEEKDDFVRFRLTGVEADQLIFKGLTLRFTGDDQLDIELMMTFGEGEPRAVPFSFTRTAYVVRADSAPTADSD